MGSVFIENRTGEDVVVKSTGDKDKVLKKRKTGGDYESCNVSQIYLPVTIEEKI